MCIPLVIAGATLAIGAATAVTSHMQQAKQAKDTERAIKENYSQQMDSLQLQYDQTNKQATDEMSVRAREAMIESARLRAISGESGLAGISNDRIQNESMFNLGTDIASIESNRQASLKQLHQEGKAIRSGNQSQINQIKRPSLIGTGLQIAGSAMDSASNFTAMKGK